MPLAAREAPDPGVAQDLDLPVALLDVRARRLQLLVGESGMTHQLGGPVRELPQDAFDGLEADVFGVEAVQEDVRGSHAGGAQRPAALLGRSARRQTALAGDRREDERDGLMQRDVVVGVEVGRRLSRENLEDADLRLELATDLGLRDAAAAAPRGCGRNLPSGARTGRLFAGAAGRPPPVNAKWRPRARLGARSAASRIPRAAAFSSTMTVAEVTMPRVCAWSVPALTPGDRPKSSALTMRRFTG